MRHNPLPTEYVEALDSNETFCLIIMGKDPYPKEAVGIPFCKPSWDSMCDKRISGLFVLQSIGLDIKKARNGFKVPADYFVYLAKEKGIAFLNLSYHYLNDSVRKKHYVQLQSAEKVNKKYLFRSKATVLCGEAKKIIWYEGDYPSLHYAVHPSRQCNIHKNQKVRDSWSEWWSDGALKKKFQL